MGLARFFILRVLHEGPLHGYAITHLVERTTNACCSPTEGTLVALAIAGVVNLVLVAPLVLMALR